MTTFLEYLCETLFGEPVYRQGNGHSEWDCPFYGQARKFSTYPYTPQYKDRAKCWSCNQGGDAADILKLAIPDLRDWDVRRSRLERLRAEFEADRARAVEQAGDRVPAGHPISFRGIPGGSVADDFDTEVVRDAFSGLAPDEAGQLYAAVALARGKCPDAPFQLIWYAHRALRDRIEHDRRIAEENARHMAECTDDRCDFYCCRKARGWSDNSIRIALQRSREKAQKAKRDREERDRRLRERLRAYLRERHRQLRNGKGGH
jgi:hypothetical protein